MAYFNEKIKFVPTIIDLVNSNKVLVFSKSYYPRAIKVKRVLEGHYIKHKVIELDKIPDGEALHSELKTLCGFSTVP